MLLNWGINKSNETGLPCYLQASEQGARLYQKYGFEVIDTVKFDLSQYDLSGLEKMTEMIRYISKSHARVSVNYRTMCQQARCQFSDTYVYSFFNSAPSNRTNSPSSSTRNTKPSSSSQASQLSFSRYLSSHHTLA
jgi:hypothetical protein